jgi:hypothetical protein
MSDRGMISGEQSPVYMGPEHYQKYQAWCAAGCPDVISIAPPKKTQYVFPSDPVIDEAIEEIQQEMRDWVNGNAKARAVSADAPTISNVKGGSQSYIPVRFDLLDANALFAAAGVLHEGADKYGAGNWRLIPVRDHLNHLLTHVYAYLAGDRSDDHLSHALCRATFALGVELDPEATPEKDQT